MCCFNPVHTVVIMPGKLFGSAVPRRRSAVPDIRDHRRPDLAVV
jgi:hypothetical protein